jgi:hypothetical protein
MRRMLARAGNATYDSHRAPLTWTRLNLVPERASAPFLRGAPKLPDGVPDKSGWRPPSVWLLVHGHHREGGPTPRVITGPWECVRRGSSHRSGEVSWSSSCRTTT